MSKKVNLKKAKEEVLKQDGTTLVAFAEFEYEGDKYDIKINKVVKGEKNFLNYLIREEHDGFGMAFKLPVEDLKAKDLMAEVPIKEEVFEIQRSETMIECLIVSKASGRSIFADYTAIELLKKSPEDIIEEMDDNECTCNTEGGYSYCGCGDEFEECDLFVDGKLIEEW